MATFSPPFLSFFFFSSGCEEMGIYHIYTGGKIFSFFVGNAVFFLFLCMGRMGFMFVFFLCLGNFFIRVLCRYWYLFFFFRFGTVGQDGAGRQAVFCAFVIFVYVLG
jgi:hypothetical protein